MKRVAIIVSTVGFHWEELFDAFREFKRAGWIINFFTVNGRKPVADPNSVEINYFLSTFGIGVSQEDCPETELGKELNFLLKDFLHIDNLDVDQIDAIFLPGGHGCVFDVNISRKLHKKIYHAYKKNKVLAAVCHGTSAFSFVKDGAHSIVHDKELTGFPDALDNILIKSGLVYEDYIPLPYMNEEKMKEAGAKISPFNFLQSIINPKHVKVDYPFITGIGPKASEDVAREVIDLEDTV
jgi:putative intracellular protease/amidase